MKITIEIDCSIDQAVTLIKRAFSNIKNLPDTTEPEIPAQVKSEEPAPVSKKKSSKRRTILLSKECPICKNTFTPTRSIQEFCSRSCNNVVNAVKAKAAKKSKTKQPAPDAEKKTPSVQPHIVGEELRY